ncbi:MAG: hypothetical protein K6U80_15480 [Firmicutes bacterium]|nr:hypothetical protein [Bacillota bacterium]
MTLEVSGVCGETPPVLKQVWRKPDKNNGSKMKISLVLTFVLFLIAGAAAPARGDLFTATAGIESSQFTIEGATAPFNYGISGRLYSIAAGLEADLGIRLGAGISYGDINGAALITIYPRIDWGFQIYDYTFRISEGYQTYIFRLNGPGFERFSYGGMALGILGQWKISEMLTVTGAVQIPQTGAFYQGDQLIAVNTPVARSYQYGLRITFLPLITFMASSSYTKIGDDATLFRLENHGNSFGVMLRW